MTLEEKLKEVQAKLSNLVEAANRLGSEREQVLQEAIRCDGQLRLLNELIAERNKEVTPS